ncbi:MAG: mechanosensitive ion channel family protein [Parvibaculaceae bacterium]
MFLLLCLLVSAAPARAQNPAAPEKLPPNVETLLSMLADPGVQAWLHDHQSGKNNPDAASQTPQPHASRPSHFFADYVAAIRNHIYGLASAMKDLPAQFERAAAMLLDDIDESGPLGLLALVVVLVGCCFFSGLIYRRAVAKFVRRNGAATQASTWHKLSLRTEAYLLDLGEIAIVGAAGTVVFLALDYWPDVLERIILAYLLAYVAWRLVHATSRYLLVSKSDFRIVPVDDGRADFWTRQIDVLNGVAMFGYATVVSICLLGFSDQACEVLAYAVGLLLLVIAIYTLNARISPREDESPVARPGMRLSLSLSLIVLWCLWALGATPIFLLGSILVGLFCAIKLTKACIDHCFGDSADTTAGFGNSRLTAMLIERTIRFALILLALGLAMWAWDVDFTALSAAGSGPGRFVHGAIVAVIILLAANFTWNVVRTLIDLQIAKLRNAGDDPEQVNRFATLLPVLRNFLWATIAAFAILMALSELGIEIAPLIAGAGVAGVAIGFGAQTLVKDIISGIFYLLDDAFRVGDYIESGNYKGTVESFSLRSVKLRHNRGPIFTVPFGVLGAVQNMSRDWVIEKLKLTITYDSDVEKARKVIKRIGLELAEDPELKFVTLEPLKMQGVEDFSDYGVVLKLKLKTKPGQQFLIRRRAMVLIKREFEASGIKFASPYIHIAGSVSSRSDQGLDTITTLGSLTKPAPAT